LIPEGSTLSGPLGWIPNAFIHSRQILAVLGAPRCLVSWTLGAVPAALRKMRQTKSDVIFTTFPIATAVWIGLILHRLSGKPWIVDFRDSMTEDNYPRDSTTWRLWRWLEGQAILRASLLLFTAESAIRMYRQRYPHLPAEKCLLLPNGYDESDFAELPAASFARQIRAVRFSCYIPVWSTRRSAIHDLFSAHSRDSRKMAKSIETHSA